ncbi:MAG: hypothetical protein ACJ78Q_18795 [Chloroflexia bacterium]
MLTYTTRKGFWLGWVLVVLMVAPAGMPVRVAHAQEDGYTSAQTGKTVRGKFLERYWAGSDWATRYGLPVSDAMQERSETDGKVYTVQYFEWVTFELHPENAAPYDVLFSLLGVFEYNRKYPKGAPGQESNASAGSLLFPETGKRLGCQFLDYWLRNGGLMQYGFPISEEFTEKSEVDGNSYRVQYFQRAVLVSHGEKEPPENVARLPLGSMISRARYPQQAPALTPTATAAQSCAPTAHGGSYSDTAPDGPQRSSVGKGHVMAGVVRASGNCAPIVGAKVVYWLAGLDGQYDDDHIGAVFSDGSGAYRFETNFPGLYGGRPVPHIHLYASAPGYREIETEYFPACGETDGTFDFVLAAREK